MQWSNIYTEALTVRLFVFATAPWWLLLPPSWGDGGELLGEDSGSKVCSEGEAPNPSEKFLRDSDVAKNIFFFLPQNR